MVKQNTKQTKNARFSEQLESHYLCDDCLNEKIDSSLKANVKKLKAEVTKMIKAHPNKADFNFINCSICKSKKATACPYCLEFLGI